MAKKLYVGPILASVTDRDLKRLFAQYGTVTNIQIPRHPVMGGPMGFGFVEMADGADKAIAALNGTKFEGCVLTVNEAQGHESQPRANGRPSLPFLEAISANPTNKVFRVVDSSIENPAEWELQPLETEVLSNTDSNGLHVMKALNLLPDESMRECYMDMNLPERISDYAFFEENGSLRHGYRHEFAGQILPAVAVDCFGVYELFYSKQRPQLGIDILKRGLTIAKRKHYIAEDLGYILRDERRFEEAAEMFKIAVEEGPSSHFIYGELAGAYAELGDFVNEKKYSAMFKRTGGLNGAESKSNQAGHGDASVVAGNAGKRAWRKARPTYERGGRVAWLRFVLVSAGYLLLAAVMGWVWSLVRSKGWNFWLITGAVFALPLALAGYWAVALGHCRNRWVAGVLGVLAALVFHGSYFHADLVRELGLAAVMRLDLLQEYIFSGIARDGREMPRILPRGQASPWLPSAVQLLASCFLIGSLTVYRSLRGYCERCHRWMRSILIFCEPGTATQIFQALESGEFSTIPVTFGRLPFGHPSSSLEFEYCPALREPPGECVAYLTLKEVTSLSEYPKILLSQAQLWPEELDALGQSVPALAWLRVSAPTSGDDQEISPPVMVKHSPMVPVVERLPSDAGAREFDSIGRIALLISIGCLCLPLMGVLLAAWGMLRAPWLQPLGTVWLDWLVSAAGIAATAIGGLICWFNIDFPAILFGLRWLRRVISTRPDAVVSAYDPAARLVNVVPRAQWHRMQGPKPADRGLLVIDRDRRKLLFEGVKERYAIPVDAVLTCLVEPMLPQATSLNFFAVVLTVRHQAENGLSLIGGYRDSSWEIPFVCRPTQFRRYNTAYRRILADSLCSEIEALK